MCWGVTASVAMLATGTAATAVCLRRGEPAAIWGTVAYFTAMELLQSLGYAVVDECGSTANRTVTQLSYLHIVLQPLVINAFAMALAPAPVPRAMRRAVHAVAAICSAVMAVQMLDLPGIGPCRPGSVLCGPDWCTVSGTWHIGWEVPLNGLFTGMERLRALIGLEPSFPSYIFACLILPLVYGSWRLVLYNVVFGFALAMALTDDPNEMPAIWCLFSVGIVIMGLSPLVRRRVMGAAPGGA